jgi:hypothetical protein
MQKTMKGIIIFKGKYGATRQYAEWLEKNWLYLFLRRRITGQKILSGCDFVIIGS